MMAAEVKQVEKIANEMIDRNQQILAKEAQQVASFSEINLLYHQDCALFCG